MGHPITLTQSQLKVAKVRFKKKQFHLSMEFHVGVGYNDLENAIWTYCYTSHMDLRWGT
jgi:hypothetical protein